MRRAVAAAGRVVAGAAILARAAAAQTPAPDVMTMTIRELAPRVYVIAGFTNGNILALDDDAGVLLVDAQTTRRVALADSALRTVTRRPVRWIVDTHYHDDHVEGNAYWRARGAAVIAQENVVPRALRDTTIALLDWHHTPLSRESLPTRTFRDTLTLTVGAEVVQLVHVPGAHTDGDVIVRLPRRNVIHTGDILEVNDAPFIDWWAGGSLDGTIRGVDRILALCDDRTRLVPGHGAVVDRRALARYRAALVATSERVRTALGRGDAPADGAALVPDEFLDVLGGPVHAARFARLTYAGLKDTGS